MPDASVDLIITDPPYNTGLNSKVTSAENHPTVHFNGQKATKQRLCSFFNDNMDKWDYEKLMRDAARALFRVLKPNKACYVFIDWRNYHLIREWFIWAGFTFKQALVWDKVVHGLNYQNYAYTYEMVCYFVKGEYWHKRQEIKKDVITLQRVNQNNEFEHETVKPISLLRKFIKDNSEGGEVVLDPFIGSGTVAVACKQTGRLYVGFEIIKDYCDLANKRLSQNNLLNLEANEDESKNKSL